MGRCSCQPISNLWGNPTAKRSTRNNIKPSQRKRKRSGTDKNRIIGASSKDPITGNKPCNKESSFARVQSTNRKILANAESRILITEVNWEREEQMEHLYQQYQWKIEEQFWGFDFNGCFDYLCFASYLWNSQNNQEEN